MKKNLIILIILFSRLLTYSLSSNNCRLLKDDSFEKVSSSQAYESKFKVDLDFDFSFHSTTYRSIYIDFNGKVTFDTYSDTLSEPMNMREVDYPMIAAFWANANFVTEGSRVESNVYYKVTNSSIIIVWENKLNLYASNYDLVQKTNVFQLVLTNWNDPLIPDGNNISFYYDKMDWTTGEYTESNDGFGGTSATVGISEDYDNNYIQTGRFDRDGYETYVPGYEIGGVKWLLLKKCDLKINTLDTISVKVNGCNPSNNTYTIDAYVSQLVQYYGEGAESQVKLDGMVIKTKNSWYGTWLYNSNEMYADGYTHEISLVYTYDTMYNVSKKYKAPSTCMEKTSCQRECITSFMPQPGRKYVLSAWVKEEVWQSKSDYSNSYIILTYRDSKQKDTIRTRGTIIDGWQRIEGAFIVPNSATDISINLVNNGSEQSFFDDIRVHPFNSTMKSFVYDPSTSKLIAELNEDNYAAYYEYDEEGQLVRVKQETERGIKTINESRSSNVKNQTK